MVPEKTAAERLRRLVRGIHCAARTCHLSASVTDPDPSDPHIFLGLPDLDPLVRGPDPSTIEQKTLIPNVL
jgi:hypothetical protein